MTWTPPPPPRLPLPAGAANVPGCFWRPNAQFVDELAKALAGRKVLELFAGNGYLAGHLHRRGVQVTATSVLSSMDAHSQGIYHPVVDMDAVDAVAQFGPDHDVLLLCWPTTTPRGLAAADLWRHQRDRDIAFVGEFTNYELGHLGGCMTDEFFERFEVTRDFASYRDNILERACLGRLQPAPTPTPESINTSKPTRRSRHDPH